MINHHSHSLTHINHDSLLNHDQPFMIHIPINACHLPGNGLLLWANKALIKADGCRAVGTDTGQARHARDECIHDVSVNECYSK